MIRAIETDRATLEHQQANPEQPNKLQNEAHKLPTINLIS